MAQFLKVAHRDRVAWYLRVCGNVIYLENLVAQFLKVAHRDRVAWYLRRMSVRVCHYI